MFAYCSSLTSLNLSNFDTSKVTIMHSMFAYCSKLKFLELSNFKTSEVSDMGYMFINCSSLTSLNLSNFDTSKVTDMSAMFAYCSKLTFLDLSNYDTSEVFYMSWMFYDCTSLISLNLSSFDTSKVENMIDMFYGCHSLSILNISNFDTSKVSNMEEMFMDCSNLQYLNLKNAKIKINNINLNNIFQNTGKNLVACTSDNLLISKLVENKCTKIDCSENWQDKRKRINVEDNSCVDNCNLIDDTFEYDFKCYKNCPKGSFRYLFFDSNKNTFIICMDLLEGFYLDENDLIYKQCFSKCKTCDKKGNETYHNCLQCKDNYKYHYNYLNYTNCYNNCSYYKYFNIITNSYHCTNSFNCPSDYNKLILNKMECIDDCKKDENYKYEYLNQCYTLCPNETINNSFICEKPKKKIFRFDIEGLNITIDLDIIDEKIYYETQIEDILIYFTSTIFLKKMNNTNKSTIDFGLCENILKNAYNISNNNSLYILLLNIKEIGMKIPKLEYEIFNLINSDNLLKLNLSYCKDEKAEITNPITINDDIDKYNSTSVYYNDICNIATSDYGTDICLKDRRRNFIDNNLTLCEENCDLIGYDYFNNKSICSCEIKIKLFSPIKDVKFDKERLKKNFIDINNIANIQFMKCYKIALRKENIRKNIGFYILFFVILLFFCCLYLFYHKYYNLLINEIVDELFYNKINKDINKSNINFTDNPEYKDYVLNSLLYDEAKKLDNRTFFQYYCSLIKTRNLLLLAFYPKKDFNSRIIKIFFIFFYFVTNFTVSALFYNDSTMHKIYEEKGEFNIIYQIPKMIYSCVISSLICIIIKYLSFSGNNIFELKHKRIKYLKSFSKIFISELFKKIKIKFVFLFIITPIFLFSFWYYITCFCGIYKNTQRHLIKETLSSFIMSLIYPLILVLIPIILRRNALKSKNKRRQYMFKFSRLLEYIF